MTVIFFLGFFILSTIGSIVVWSKTDKNAKSYESEIPIKGAWALAALINAVLFIIVAVVTSVFYVEARTVGIVTSFGKPVHTSGPGLNIAWPWEEVTSFSTGNQTIDFDGTDGSGSPVGFKLAGEVSGGEASAHINITWQVQNDDKAIKLWENWKEFDRVKDQLVDKNSRAVIAGVMGRYDSDQANKGANLVVFSEAIKQELNTFFADKGISVETVAVMRVDFSPQVQDRINKKYQDQQDIERAKIQQERAAIEAQTNATRQTNLSESVLKLKCLELTNAWNVGANGQLPSGWNCLGPVGTVLPR